MQKNMRSSKLKKYLRKKMKLRSNRPKLKQLKRFIPPVVLKRMLQARKLVAKIQKPDPLKIKVKRCPS